MVKNLLKYECAAAWRSLLPVRLAVIGVAALLRLLQIFETDTAVYDIVFGSGVAALIIASLTCLVLTAGVAIIRFYRHLFTSQGYLTLSLPVREETHIFTKLTVAVGSTLLSLLVLILGVMIATAGEALNELCNAAAYLLRALVNVMPSTGWMLLQFALFCILAVAAFYLLTYACITVGQMAKRARIWAAIGVFFGYYFITQIFSTVLLIRLTVTDGEGMPLFEQLLEQLDVDPAGFVHNSLWIGIAVTALLGGIYFLVARVLMKRRLNVE